MLLERYSFLRGGEQVASEATTRVADYLHALVSAGATTDWIWL